MKLSLLDKSMREASRLRMRYTSHQSTGFEKQETIEALGHLMLTVLHEYEAALAACGAPTREQIERAAKDLCPGYPSDQAFFVKGAKWALAALAASGDPIPMRLLCPHCYAPHVDEGEWATRPHKTHLCARCGQEWRPADIPTVGVSLIGGSEPSEEKPYTKHGHDDHSEIKNPYARYGAESSPQAKQQ